MLTDPAAIRAALADHQSFGECVITDVGWAHHGTSIEVPFDYIWNGDGTRIRDDLGSRPHIVVVRAVLVQEMHLANALNPSMLQEPERMNWGLSEVAQVVLVEDSELARPYSHPRGLPCHHLAIEWEADRRIDIVAFGFELDEKPTRSPD
ncbi:hypothetical protein DP939_04120 [Spongiactinospora rosea]|uniref:Uncharacterized protein n=1 Tax=Spongiactinospora rosea TaxID=2248750 RepID=A0A366M8K0_9ACTN|nr:hypothetical protein [Spongiactinospora rosea]RBQ21869.1 hypothetical protein DP939_04120 [Spongiactinospora rosea]